MNNIDIVPSTTIAHRVPMWRVDRDGEPIGMILPTIGGTAFVAGCRTSGIVAAYPTRVLALEAILSDS